MIFTAELKVGEVRTLVRPKDKGGCVPVRITKLRHTGIGMMWKPDWGVQIWCTTVLNPETMYMIDMKSTHFDNREITPFPIGDHDHATVKYDLTDLYEWFVC